MQLVMSDGRVLAGADAAPELLRRIRGLGWLAPLIERLPWRRRAFTWIAGTRMRISCTVGADVPAPGPTR